MKRLLLVLILTAIPAFAVKPVNIFTRSVPAGQNGVAYSATVKAKFGTKPYTWSIGSGALPTGLSIAGATGIISGTPTVNNTFNFVVHVVDSAGSPTTDDQGLFIVISGSAPPPTPSVSITTGSLPTGIVGGAYSTVLQASGGTAPYTWSITNGALPPAAALTAGTGGIAGTLTASGTYTLTARVTDSSTTPQTFDRAFAITVDQAVAPTYLFSDTLANGLAAWGFVWNASEGNPSSPVACPGGGNCMQIHYSICGDSTNPACGAAHQDDNRWVKRYLSTSLDHIFLRGRVYLKTPEPGAVRDGIQRKLYWFSPHSEMWTVLLTTDTVTSNPGAIYFRAGNQADPTCGVSSRAVTFVVKTGYYDTFRTVEMEVDLNTPGVADGTIKLWLDGVLQPNVFNDWNMRGTCTENIEYFSVGRQSDRNNYNVVDEYRYWKDVVMNDTGPIGP